MSLLDRLLGTPREIDVVDEDGTDCAVGRFRSEASARAYAEMLGYQVVAVHDPTGRSGPSRREMRRRDDDSAETTSSSVEAGSSSDAGTSSDGGSSSDGGGGSSGEA